VGQHITDGGRYGEAACCDLSQSLEHHGLELQRLKTGTPPRLDARTIHYDGLGRQDGDDPPVPFSFMTDVINQTQLPCHITWTNEKTHAIIRDNLHRAPLHTGQIKSVGPRYCPSIETKIERFADKDHHQVFLEPEGRNSHWVYCNGISTSLPMDVQEAMVHSIAGLEDAEFLRYGYAIEYDYVPPIQIRSTLETRAIAGLFTAGQINGTSGYEEAGGQGLLAGLNAARMVLGFDGVTLRRDQAYIGVMIDDLVTRGIVEPYRMFTSRAEYRLLLRSDNAQTRLTPLAREWGLVDDQRWNRFEAYRRDLEAVNALIDKRVVDGKPLSQWLGQPEKDIHWLQRHVPDVSAGRDSLAVAQAVIEARYGGYISRQQSMIDRMARCEVMRLPVDLDYRTIGQLRRETQEILNHYRPETLGQAGRIAGVNPADITVLLVHFQKTRPSSR
jgi:tRNA uridine 5-carboxymethylaminomethyl modification enzyme